MFWGGVSLSVVVLLVHELGWRKMCYLGLKIRGLTGTWDKGALSIIRLTIDDANLD